MRRFHLLVSVIFFILHHQTAAQDLSPDLIAEVFGPPLENIEVQPTTGPSTFAGEDGESCTCVPYFLCDPATNTTFQDGKFDGFGVIDIRFKPESCQESVEVCCKTPRSADNPIPIVEHPERLSGCGIRNEKGVDFQITGSDGHQAEFGEYPWTVAILNTGDSSAVCVGSLIHPQVVLTGAHCLINKRPIELKIRAGEWDTQTIKERLPHQERKIDRFISHPQFNAQTLANDISLIILAEPVVLADNINTICLPDQDFNFENARKCVATGWGKTNFGKAGRYAVIMKEIVLDAVEFNKCQLQFQKTRLGPRFRLHKSFLCAGGQQGKDTCQGDGGAPLVCPQGLNGQKRYEQAGIVAWGIGCGDKDVPGAYTYVSKFRQWIDSNMAQAGFDPSTYTRRK